MEIIVGIVTVIVLPLLVWLVVSKYKDDKELDALLPYMDNANYNKYDYSEYKHEMDELYNITTVGDARVATEVTTVPPETSLAPLPVEPFRPPWFLFGRVVKILHPAADCFPRIGS